MPDGDTTLPGSPSVDSGFFADFDEVVSLYDENFQLIECTPRHREAYVVESLIETSLWHIYPELLAPGAKSAVEFVVATGLPRTVEIAHASAGPRRTLLIFRSRSGVGVVEAESSAMYRETFRQSESDRALLLHQATHDVLTGLPNRRQFSDQLRGALPVPNGAQVALMQIDLDDFKPINDTLGHGAGDAVLKMAADRIRSILRDREFAYRLAGDEFAVIQWRSDQPSEAERLADALINAFKEPFMVEGINVFVGASVGIAVAPEDGNEVEQLMKAADIALYAAKKDGRGRSSTFTRSMLVVLEQREMLRRSLRTALQEGQFFLEYQPLVKPSSSVAGFEALLRWRHPLVGTIPPNVFIPMAEADGLMSDIGRWLLERACRTAMDWPSHFTLAVNLSPAEFLHEGLTDRVAQTLDLVGMRADRLELEITESVLLERTINNLDTLNTLNVLGVQISLDDFGTYYSSLSYLKNFPFDTIKIDQYFIKDLERNEKGQTIVRSIIALAHGLGMNVTAEGVETAGQAAWLQKEGCDRLQGYFLGAPMAADAIGDFLRKASATPATGLQRI
ncbi:EAL domain-containing protein [Sinorhizobium medicae]|uniref:EAL domain-containing protein n=2 Tax=Sinorhizobium medicae TaxID=110321 RepID=A0A6G1WK74_9HYPH|nr:EAL domain-containing protein [Sinorhizobium medicae]ABR62496.1 diguanylate cyclase/phosphodiesterase [Sinorhizobium medicae WSM419]MDX0407766.1 EAL domain-containing protein [Sinorhizobium medicae]MDX0413523.1 EAL domain-containing protein [Sinorhizobium medicae]MDX0419793.1 EAL domain-containing protein [Sinorhizobium medicae]MDX0425823.1 EAL domain-containing protein [Sinorhizobium medicae]